MNTLWNTFLLLAVGIASIACLNTMKEVQTYDQDGRIIFGHDKYDARYFCSLFIFFQDGSIYFCGCSIISETCVLTAAHCVTNSTHVADAVLIIAGVDSLENAENAINRTVFSSGIIVDNQFDPDVVGSIFDIALLTLDEAYDFEADGDVIAPIFIAPDDGDTYVGETATVVGRGIDDAIFVFGVNSDITPQTKSVDMKIVSNKQCSHVYGIQNEYIICADSHIPGAGTCFGDSGGPMYVDYGYGCRVQIGIVDFVFAPSLQLSPLPTGLGSCLQTYYTPDGFQRVSYYNKWIRYYCATASDSCSL